MTIPTSSLRLQRLLGGGVAALLTANAFALASLVADDGGAGERLRRPAATGEAIVPRAETPPTVALVTTADGRTFLADPGTAEGRRAIDDARRDGGTVREVTVPPGTSTTRPGSSLPLPGRDRSADLPGLLGSILPQGVPGTDTTGGSGSGDDDGGGLLEIVDPGLIDDLLQDPVGTVTSVVQDAPGTVTSVVKDVRGTVTSVVQDPPGTVTSIVESTPSTVTSVLDGATSTVSSVLDQAPVTLPPVTVPPLGLLGHVVSTVVATVETVTPTTAPPAPADDPVCTLLVLC